VNAGLAAAGAAQPLSRVVLVGAGPGSVDLLTLKAARLIAEADWLVHDALVQPEVLALADRAVIISVGKRAGRRSTRQDDINRTLIDCARRGGLVVRLKGGDPLMFARAQEELEALRAAGIAVEVVPGITTAQAAHAAIAAPMTERGRRRSMVFATPQVQAQAAGPVVDESSGEPVGAAAGGADLQWARALVNAGGGALYMASSVASRTRAALLSLGMPADTPATWVINVSLPGQAVLATTVGELGPLPQEHSGKPALLLLGTAVVSALPPVASARPSSRVVAQSIREPATATLSS
jgi:uroporphyrin-III C-methyltransferase